MRPSGPGAASIRGRRALVAAFAAVACALAATDGPTAGGLAWQQQQQRPCATTALRIAPRLAASPEPEPRPRRREDGAELASPLPLPFDDAQPSVFQGAGSADDRCPRFMAGLLADRRLRDCYPVSMLLQTSTGFFEAEKQLPSIVRVLDAACAVDLPACADFMAGAADRLAAEANCRAELDGGQSRVLQAWRGLLAYRTLHAATCLRDGDPVLYCFAGAVGNLDDPSDSYLYFMPLGLALPAASRATCGPCVRRTMHLFHAAAAAARADPVADKYPAAARQINARCGAGFVNDTLPHVLSRAAPPPPRLAALAALAAALVALASPL